MNQPIDLNDQAIYDEPGSWGRLSQGWPETREHAYAKYVFCNMTGVVPYGSYVFIGDPPYNHRIKCPKGVLRIVNDGLLENLNQKFKIAREYILAEEGK